ncbi:conjugative relaxase-like TrwC/TraI family protein [Kribbella amoyensis]|uniref:Conjugative relaxase-like TrwC/TraI family protein n=1 Tax=Kribbella amoyensis TaxID=996641 RepID=A0A561BRY3_9ACTN|nr:MobF family relaxase [Kribbella amoyensis]TWD81654.1 conjugative relaxase-like TrwC/TraI family protein [Kribbella amoyensis]
MSIKTGHSADYLTGAVAAGRENYYTGATAAGEPPGRWYGRGAEALGLAGEVDAQDMTALYERFIDPRDERFGDPMKWDEAATLGHTGRAYKTEAELVAAALAKEPWADKERQDEIRAEAAGAVQKNASFHDATFSVQKSVTVLHTAFEAQEVKAQRALAPARGALLKARQTGAPAREVHRLEQAVHRLETEAATWGEHRKAVEDAIWAGNNAALDYLSDKAGYVRIGHHGGASGRWADAHDWTVASFFQHDSRNHDPQIHIHNAILAKAQAPSGKWLKIDSKAMYKYQSAAGAVGERVMEQHLTKALGVAFQVRPDGEAREIVGVDQAAMDLFSSRRLAITKKTAALVDQFRRKYGREPNALELDHLQERATLATRRAKSKEGETVEARLERWDRELRAEVAGGLRRVANEVLQHHQHTPADTSWDEDAVLEQALAAVQETQAAWRPGDLTRAISMALPDDLGDRDPAELVELLDRLTDKGLARAVCLDAERPGSSVLPSELLLANGTSSYNAPGRALYATAGHLNAESALTRAGYRRGAPVMTHQHAGEFVKQLGKLGLKLGADQDTALRAILSSGALTEALVGPAGTGKSRVVGALARAWADPELWHGDEHRVIGLASSQIATEVLTADGVPAMNVSQWLTTQRRIMAGSAAPQALQLQLRAGDLVVLDESGMTSTQDLAEIHEHCARHSAKLLLVGDQRQLAAVGAGGGMDLVISRAHTHELTETRRFSATWEGPASLRLRVGDKSVLGDYHRHGRIVDGGNVEHAETLAGDAWLADRVNGLNSLLLVDTNDQAARVSAQLRARLVNYGLVDDTATVRLGLQGTRAGRGDIIQARENDWSLARLPGNRRAAINRATYKVVDVLPDGGLTVAPIEHGTTTAVSGETMTLPARYVESHVALAYASTVHAAQGLTVDTSHGVVTSTTSLNSLYVQASRGRASNKLYVVTRAVPADLDTGETALTDERTARSVLLGIFDTVDERREKAATTARAESSAEAARHRTPAELLADAIEMATAARASQWLDSAAADGLLTDAQRTKLASEAGAATLTALLRRVELAGHDPDAVLRDAIARRDLGNARELSNVIQGRITKTTRLDPVGATYSQRLPAVDSPEWSAYLERLALDADTAARDLAFDLAEQSPPWLVKQIGHCPDGADEAEAWIGKAATVAGYRDLVGWTSDTSAIGPAPSAGQTEAYAAWRAAWDALDRPEDQRAEAEMTVGQLRVRVAAYQREQSWAPPYVGEELAGTRQAADKARQQAALRDAEADVSDDHDTRERLRTQANEARALAQAHDALATDLSIIDDARAQWLVHTAATKSAAVRAEAELKDRGIKVQEPDDNASTTTSQWLAAQRQDDDWAVRDEHDLAEIAEARERDLATAQPGDESAEAEILDNQLDAAADNADLIPAAELVADEPAAPDVIADPAKGDRADEVVHDTAEDDDEFQVDFDHELDHELAPADLRKVTEREPRVLEADELRVPSADETAEAVRRAQRALIELRQRERADAEREAAEAAAERREDDLAAWHTEREAADTTANSHNQQAGHALGLDD